MGLADFLTQSATIAPVTGRDGVGMPTLGAAVNVDCKFTRVVAFQPGNSGITIEEESPDAVMFVRSAVVADPEDQVTFENVEYKIMQVIHRKGTATALLHKKLLLKEFS